MATINLLNSGWQTQTQTSTIDITASSTSVWFNMGYDLTKEMKCAKACIAFDVSNYKTITLEYSSVYKEGVTSLYFGVFDGMTANYYYNSDYDQGISSSSLSGTGVTEITSNSNKTITVDVSSLTGTKYVGFLFYGNTHTLNANVGWSVQQQVNITSLTAAEIGYKLTYSANGGSGAPSSVYDVTSTTISSTVPARSGYDFLGWSTSSSATYASYIAGNLISLRSDTTLYAVWRKKTYEVIYNANGGSGAPSIQYKTHGETFYISSTKPTKAPISAGSYTVTLNTNGGICAFELLTAKRVTSYSFSEWNTNSSGTGTSYKAGASYEINDMLSLYAIYDSNTSTDVVSLPTPTRDGYEFLGWATSTMATSGTTGSYTPKGNVTLYAIWKSVGFVYIYDGVEFGPYQVLIYDGSGWNQYMPYIYTYSGWELYSG